MTEIKRQQSVIITKKLQPSQTKQSSELNEMTSEASTPSYCQPKPLLHQHGYSTYSQNGEDGIIQKIFETIGTKTKIAIEFGAW